jgi:hypothetical protein
MKKLLILLGAGVIAIAMLVTAVTFFASSTPFKHIEGEHALKYSPDERELYVFYKGEIVCSPIECDVFEVRSRSKDCASILFAVHVGKGNDMQTTFYLANADDIKALPENDIEYAELSGDGRMIKAFSADDTYYLYDPSNNTKTKIDFMGGKLDTVVFSKGYNSILYTSVTTVDKSSTVELYLYTDGKSQKLANNMYPLAVSDDGEHIFAYEVESGDTTLEKSNTSDLLSLYEFRKDGEKVKIANNFKNEFVHFTDGCTQILYVSDDKAYFHEHGKDSSVKLGNAFAITPIYPAGSHSIEDFCGLPVSLVSSEYGQRVYRVEKDESKVEKLASDTIEKHLTADGKTLYYVKNDSLRRVDVDDSDSEQVLVEANIHRIHFSPDGEDIYYSSEGTLYYVSTGIEPVEITDDARFSDMSRDGLYFYIDNDQTLYSTSGGEKGKEIAYNVTHITSSYGTVFYFTDANFKKGVATMFYSDDGSSFENASNGKEFKYSS